MTETSFEDLAFADSPFATEEERDPWRAEPEASPLGWLNEDASPQPWHEWPSGESLPAAPATMKDWIAAELGQPQMLAGADAPAEQPETRVELTAAPEDLLDELVQSGLSLAFDDGGTPSPVRELAGEDEAPPFESFTGPEHRDIGDKASGGEVTTIVYGPAGRRLTFGEMVAMAGDWFGTYDEMAELARTAAGRTRLAWARWAALDKPKGEREPPAPKEVQKSVRQCYYKLASQNISHFSGGGSAWTAYVTWHSKALVDALEAGERRDDGIWRRALTKEAFGQHFLTDMFSAGHVRTPRAAIREWYTRHYPDSTRQFLEYMARFLYDRLNEHQQVPPLAWWFSWVAKSVIADDIGSLGGEAVKTFSLGDIVSLALHNMDNRQLRVVSDLDHNGHRVPDGYRWTAVGDSHLGTAADHPAATRIMVRAAARTSLGELRAVRDAGAKLAGTPHPDRATAIKQAVGTPFAAHGYVPREDLSPGANMPLPGVGVTASPLEWRWGQMGEVARKEVDLTVRKDIADELFGRLGDVPDPVTVSDTWVATTMLDLRIRGTRAAFRAFTEHLRSEGIRALELAVDKPAR